MVGSGAGSLPSAGPANSAAGCWTHRLCETSSDAFITFSYVLPVQSIVIRGSHSLFFFLYYEKEFSVNDLVLHE